MHFLYYKMVNWLKVKFYIAIGVMIFFIVASLPQLLMLFVAGEVLIYPAESFGRLLAIALFIGVPAYFIKKYKEKLDKK